MNIVFVILNYNLYQETVECVKSICNNIDTKSFHIIIVDNSSPSGAGEKLQCLYKGSKIVTVLLNTQNVGFANGNNKGIDEARRFFNPKYICCLNNDTLLEQKSFYANLERTYNEDFPAVVGPKIILKDGRVQHVNHCLLTVEQYKNRIERLEKGKTGFCSLYEKLLQNRIIYELNFLRKKYRNEKVSMFRDVILHGCCLIFTPIFFEKLNGFDNRTFLYYEEHLLYISLKSKGLHNKYCPNIQIRHLEDMSTKSIAKKNKSTTSFIREHSLNSLRILVNELESTEFFLMDELAGNRY